MMWTRSSSGSGALARALVILCAAAGALGAQQVGRAAGGFSRAAAADPGAGVARVEQWACPAENLEAFRQYVASVWAPIFDGMVQEGLLSSWSGMIPSGSREVAFGADGVATVEEVSEAWGWTGIWRGGGEETFRASWQEYHRRLAAAHPDGPGPERLCTRVRVTTYRMGGGGVDR
jgi:hypothetical protein